MADNKPAIADEEATRAAIAQMKGEQLVGIIATVVEEQLPAMVEEAFAELDKDKSGSLDKDELRPVVKDTLAGIAKMIAENNPEVDQSKMDIPDDVVQGELDRFLAEFDTDKSGTIDKKEFAEFLRPLVFFAVLGALDKQ
eukprot:comp11883_c0_seq1/m.6528 comp11883_c0_seq1/g.6528  ORF comp11883_c0_seq1/g.6528 comp11883_c0_seq1/m.6528 type:complete len:140 (-) comp11883_c0_seq1:216-635(-)